MWLNPLKSQCVHMNCRCSSPSGLIQYISRDTMNLPGTGLVNHRHTAAIKHQARHQNLLMMQSGICRPDRREDLPFCDPSLHPRPLGWEPATEICRQFRVKTEVLFIYCCLRLSSWCKHLQVTFLAEWHRGIEVHHSRCRSPHLRATAALRMKAAACLMPHGY